MPPNNPYVIPDYVTTDAELRAWYERELEKLGDEPAPGKELDLLRSAKRFYHTLKLERNIRITGKESNPYKGPLVSALMESGWELKRGSQERKSLRPNAIRIFEEALRLIPENPKACYRLGHLLKSRGNFGEATGYFSRALELANRQDDFQEDLKLNGEQIANAIGLSMALLQNVMGSFDLGIEFSFDPEQIATLQNLLQQTWYSHVVYSTKVGGSIETRTIDSCKYDDIIRSLESDPEAFVVDRYNPISLIRYLDKEKPYEQYPRRSGKLNYLLKAMEFEDLEMSSIRDNTITQNILRVNDDLQDLEVDDLVKIAYSRKDGGRIFCSRCDLSVHYFKSLLD